MCPRYIVACTVVLALCGSASAQTNSSRAFGWSSALALHLATSAPGAALAAEGTNQISSHRRARTSESEAEFRKAVEAAQAKDFATAEPLLKKAAEDNPKNYQAWFYLGYVYSETNRSDDAIAAYQKAVALQPGVVESNLN